MKTTQLLLAAGIVTLMSGCASIVTDRNATINLATSNGQTTKVTIDGQEFSAPGVVSVLKNGEDKLIIAKDEKCTAQTLAKKEVELAFWGNILTGGLLGSTTDYSTDKMWTYSDTVMINCNS